MAEKTIGHLIEVTKQENAESRGATKQVASEVSALSKMFGKYFKDLKNQRGDKLEEKREAKKKASASALPDLSQLMSDTKGMGFLGMIAGITAAIAGLAVGVVEGFARAARLISGSLIKTMAKMVKSVTKLVLAPFRAFVNKFFPDTGKKLQKVFNRIRKVFNNGIARIAKRIDQLKDWAKGLGGRLTALAANIRTAFTNGFRNINVGLRGIAGKFRKLTFVENAAKLIGKLLKPFSGFVDDIKALKDSVTGAAKTSGDTASKIKDTAKKVKKVFTTLKQSFGGFFKIFRTLGRVVLFPLTIIMTMVDAFRGFKEGFSSSGGSIIGGVLGAISGVLKGLIGMPLDLLKGIIGWVAGKFGMEGVQEFLADFSFTDLIGKLFNAITDSVLGFIDAMKDENGKFDFGQILKVVVGGLWNLMTSIAKFPIAVGAGSLAALGAMMPGGQTPGEAFGEAFNAVMSFGKVDTGIGEAVSARQETRANAASTADAVKDATQEEKVARESNATATQMAVQTINAPTVTNNSSSTAMYNDPTPAVDNFDGLARSF